MKNPLDLPEGYRKLVDSLLAGGQTEIQIPVKKFKLRLTQVLKIPKDNWVPVSKALANHGAAELPRHKRWILIKPPEKPAKD